LPKNVLETNVRCHSRYTISCTKKRTVGVRLTPSIPQSISSGSLHHKVLVQGKFQTWKVVIQKELHHILDQPIKSNTCRSNTFITN